MKAILLTALLLASALSARADAQLIRAIGDRWAGNAEPELIVPGQPDAWNQRTIVDSEPMYAGNVESPCESCDEKPSWLARCRARLHRCWQRCTDGLCVSPQGWRGCPRPECGCGPLFPRYGEWFGFWRKRCHGCDDDCGSDMSQLIYRRRPPVEIMAPPESPLEPSAARLRPQKRVASSLGR